jgi:DNA invertase Pin-like site-specific DNA recombinase
MRRTKEFYTEKYNKAIKLYKKGMSIKDIASYLELSYSCVYGWIKNIKTPKVSKVEEFLKFLKNNGPSPISEIKKLFPKHSDIFLLAKQRGFEIKRAKLPRKFKDLSIWYYLPSQEEELKKRVRESLEKYFYR